MKKLLAVVVLVLMSLGANAALAEPGPNGNNDKGLCTAYFNGQKNGHGDGESPQDQPGPFDGLEAAGREYTDNDGVDNDRDGQTDEEGENSSLSAAENIFNYCNDNGLIGGNPAHGRFTCTDPGTAGSGDPLSDPECSRNDKPGNGDKA